MRSTLLKSVVACAVLALSTAAFAQQPPAGGTPPAPPPPSPYGPSITLEKARKAVEAAEAEAKKNGWFMAIAVVSVGGHLVLFNKMDNTQVASIAIAQHKARTAVNYRRPTKVFQDALAANPANVYLLTLDDIVASEGGIPIVEDGKIIGALGCSGGTSAQDGQTCQAGVNALKGS